MTRTLTFLALATTSLMAQTTAPPLVLPCGPNGGASVTSTGTLDVQTKATPFQVSVNVHCDASGHPTGTLTLSGLNGSPGATMTATSFVRLTSVAGAISTASLSGACSLTGGNTASTNDCHYWIMFSQLNVRTPDPQQIGIVSFSVTQGSGSRAADGAGQVVAQSGRLTVSSTTGSN